MRPHRVLVLYGTTYGQTTKIATRIAAILERHGAVVSSYDVRAVPPDVSPEQYDAVVIGASVIRGQHQRAVHEFAGRHYKLLNAMPTAFFSVSGSAASFDGKGRRDARRCADEFLRTTQWRPVMMELIGGAMAYTQYGPLLRWIMKQIAKRNRGPTDTSCDHEMTDWAQVARFADRFAALVDQSSPSTTVVAGR